MRTAVHFTSLVVGRGSLVSSHEVPLSSDSPLLNFEELPETVQTGLPVKL